MILFVPVLLFVVLAAVACTAGPTVAFVLVLVGAPGLIALDRRVMR